MLGLKKLGFTMLPEIITNMFKPPATINYPTEKLNSPKDFRGRITFDSSKCIGCKMCMRDCPAGAIRIEPTGAEKKFQSTISLDRCLFCAQCVDSCPRKALAVTADCELACFEREQFKDNQV